MAKLEDIIIGKRFRQEHHNEKDEGGGTQGSLERLANSIKNSGVIQPLAVMEKEGKYYLLAGERRTIAAAMAGLDEVPVRIYESDLSELDQREIELAENLWRKDFTPAERANLYREMVKLQQEIHGKKTSTAPDAPGVSMADIAENLGVSAPIVTEAVKLAEFMEATPEVEWGNIKTTSEAKRTMETLQKKVVRRELVKRAEKELGNKDSKVKRLVESYLINDFFKAVEHLPDKTFDLVELDPPYAIDLKHQKKTNGSLQANELGSYNEIDPKKYPAFMKQTFRECYRVMTENSWLICWFGPDPWFEEIYKWLNVAGFYTTRLVGQWMKGEEEDDIIEKTSGQSHQPTRRLANASEMFYYAWKGSPQMARPGQTNVFGYKPIPPGQKIHPTERPLDLIKDIITVFAEPGSRILVPFAGSGKTLIAAAMNKMIPVGFDLSNEYKEGYILQVKEIFKEEENALPDNEDD